MTIDYEDDDLILYDEDSEPEDEESPESGADTEEDDDDNNLFVNRSLLDRWLAKDAGNFERLEQLRQQRAKARAARRKTGKSVGFFPIDLITMLGLSPTRFVDGWKTFLKFMSLGERTSGQTDRNAGLYYSRKKIAFWIGLFNSAFFIPAGGDLLLLLLSSFGCKFALRSMGKGPFLGRAFYFILAFAAFELAWNAFKSLLRMILNVMEEACNTVESAKKEAATARKAQREQKAKADAEKAKAEQKTKTEPTPAKPIKPSGRGRNRSSGG